MSSRYASIGLYTIKFYKHGNWKYVHIDDRLPLNAAREPKYAHCKNESETWVMLLEKAYAKLHGGYENLASGWIDYGTSYFILSHKDPISQTNVQDYEISPEVHR